MGCDRIPERDFINKEDKMTQSTQKRQTPWGISDSATLWGVWEESEIRNYGTPSHGGLLLPKALNEQIPDYLRTEDGWYEEDCEWSIPVFLHPEWFEPFKSTYGKEEFIELLSIAQKTLQRWKPALYERVTTSKK
jgi:hypothetical protein